LEIREGGGIDDDDGPSSGMASFDVVDGGKVERMAKGDGGGGDGVLELYLNYIFLLNFGLKK
jgi:hypothetical protein